MDISSALVADTQAAEAVKPAQCAFDHPAPFSQPFARLDTVAGYAWSDATATQPGPMGTRSIGLVGILGDLVVGQAEVLDFLANFRGGSGLGTNA